jgi:hypothetical protein
MSSRIPSGRCALGVALLTAWAARAEPTPLRPPVEEQKSRSSGSDGIYGRLDGDLDVGLGLGAELGRPGVLGAARLTLHYFWTAGIYASYADALGHAATPVRHAAVGVHARPLFVPRWSQGWEQGPALLDLVLDSLALGVGAYWSEPRGHRFGHERGLEASLGSGLPLLASARGPWLELVGVLRSADPGFRPMEGSLMVLLAWHELVATPLIGGPEF